MSSNNDELIAGWRYLVTLQLSTPLAYLERDGKYSPGFKEPSLVGHLANSLEMALGTLLWVVGDRMGAIGSETQAGVNTYENQHLHVSILIFLHSFTY